MNCQVNIESRIKWFDCSFCRDGGNRNVDGDTFLVVNSCPRINITAVRLNRLK